MEEMAKDRKGWGLRIVKPDSAYSEQGTGMNDDDEIEFSTRKYWNIISSIN